MDNNTYSNRLEAVKNSVRVNTLVEKLRKKLKDFAIVDSQGQFAGNVKDLILDDNRQINLIVSQPSNNLNGLFLLMSRSIQKIDPSRKAIFVDISKVEIQNSHRYVMPKPQDETLPIVPEDVAQETANPDKLKDVGQYTASNISESKAVMPAQSFEAAEKQDKMNERSRIESLPASELPTSEVLEEEIIRLLEERLIVDRSRHKIGEIVVRKEIETRMIQVPVRHEKLIIEQISPERKQIAEIDLGEEINDVNLPETASTDAKPSHLNDFTVAGTFHSPKTASLLLNAIALERQHGSKEVRVEIVVEDASRQKIYQEWFDRCSKQQQ